MQQLHDLYRKILTEGESSTDRTGTGTIKLIAQQISFALSTFPAVTTKRLAWKSVVSELLWFVEGSCDERRLAEILHGTRDPAKQTIWSDNCKDRASKDPNRFNGTNVGNMYGMNWRFQPCTPHGFHWVERKSYVDDYSENHTQPELTEEFDVPEIISTAKFGEALVIGKDGNNFVVKFVNTGSYLKTTKKPTASKLKDLFAVTAGECGYLGGEVPDTNTGRKLFQMWKKLISTDKVCRKWHNFMNFCTDAYSLWGFQEFVDSAYSYQLSKEYYGAELHSPETSIFITPELDSALNSSGSPMKMYLHSGVAFTSVKRLQEFRGKSVNAKLPDDLSVLEETETHVPRPVIYIDQLQRCIDLIKTTPDSRRIVMTSWNSRDVENAALGMCHPLVQFFVKDGKLSCLFYMRSNDTFLGLPFNIASYALLTHMIAQICGLGVGELTYMGGDVHIYNNHIDQVNEQLTRVPMEEPTLWIDTSVTCINGFGMDSFKLQNYNPYASIKAPMAV